VDPRVKPGALTRDANTRLSAAEADPQTKPGAPTAAPAAVESDRYFAALDIDHNVGVSMINTYDLKKIDQDYFAEE
jgi:hypothetical protein